MIVNTSIQVNIDDTLLASLKAVLSCLQSRDDYTARHCQRVAEYAVRIGRRLQFPEKSLGLLYAGGLLHDIGKLTFSNQAFEDTSAELADEVAYQIRRHPLTGAAILSGMGHNGTICDCVLYHHERYDGSGYPYGLKKDQIPLAAQIVSIVDAFDAMTTDRPYHSGLQTREGLDVLSLERDGRFAFEMVQALIAEFRFSPSFS